MPNELTREHARALYELGINSLNQRSYVQTIRVMDKIAEINDPFYTPFALATQWQCYYAIGRPDLAIRTSKRITQLSEEQQRLLSPSWLALCFQRSGDLKRAKEINSEILELTPNDPAIISALAELSFLGGDVDEAYQWVDRLRDRAEPGYQILGRMISALVLLIRHKEDEATKELHWVGQFLISSGNIPVQAWDYRDLQPLALKIVGPPGFGTPGMVHALFSALTGQTPIAQFAEDWNKVAPAA